MHDTDLDNIEAAANGQTGVGRFAHVNDTLLLVAAVRKLRAELITALRRAESAEAVTSDLATDLEAKDSYKTGYADGNSVMCECMRMWAEDHEDEGFQVDTRDLRDFLDKQDHYPSDPPAALVARAIALEVALQPFADSVDNDWTATHADYITWAQLGQILLLSGGGPNLGHCRIAKEILRRKT